MENFIPLFFVCRNLQCSVMVLFCLGLFGSRIDWRRSNLGVITVGSVDLFVRSIVGVNSFWPRLYVGRYSCFCQGHNILATNVVVAAVSTLISVTLSTLFFIVCVESKMSILIWGSMWVGPFPRDLSQFIYDYIGCIGKRNALYSLSWDCIP